MKSYKEFISPFANVSTLTEATLTSEVIKANKGREGKPMISLVDGEEVKGTVYLGMDGLLRKMALLLLSLRLKRLHCLKLSTFL